MISAGVPMGYIWSWMDNPTDSAVSSAGITMTILSAAVHQLSTWGSEQAISECPGVVIDYPWPPEPYFLKLFCRPGCGLHWITFQPCLDPLKSEWQVGLRSITSSFYKWFIREDGVWSIKSIFIFDRARMRPGVCIIANTLTTCVLKTQPRNPHPSPFNSQIQTANTFTRGSYH